MADIITGARLRPLDFNGFSLTGTSQQAGTYEGNFLVDFDIASQYPLEAVMAESSGADFPTFVRGDPQDKVIPLHIHWGGAANQNRIDDVKEVFSPSRPIAYLRVQDENGNTRRMRAKSLGLTPWEGYDDYSYVASLHAPEPVWENDAAEGGTSTLSGTAGSLFTMDNRGNERTYPAFRFTPEVQKSYSAGWLHHWPITIAWRSPLEGVDSLGQPYPIDITNRGWDTAALIGVAELSASGSDIRVYVDGINTERYLAYLNTTGTSVWCGIAFQPARTTISATAMTAGAPPNGSEISVDPDSTTAGFPESGILLIGSEAITYKGKTDTKFLDVRRGRRGTTAASHSVGDTIYWVEHDIRMISGSVLGTAAAAKDTADKEPMFDINFSSNTSHRYGSDGLVAPETLRPGQWLRERRSPHIGADLIQMAVSGSAVLIQDLEPEAGAPNFDTLSLYLPATSASVGFEVRIGHEFILQEIMTDLEGFEALALQVDTSQLAAPPKAYRAGAASFGTTATPAGVYGDMSRLSFVGSIAKVTGSIAILSSAFVLDNAALEAVAESFDLRAEDPLLGVVFYASKSVGGNRNLQVGLSLMTDTGPGPILVSTTIATADIPTTITKFTADFSGLVGADDRRDQRLPPGTYAVQFVLSGGTTGSITIYGSAAQLIYGGGNNWQLAVGDDWAEFPESDLAVFITSRLTNGQPDTEFTTGENIAIRNAIATLSSTYTPSVVMGARQDGYLVDGVIANQSTDQAMTILAPLIVNQSLLKIDCDAHAVTVIYMTDDHEVDALWMVEPGGVFLGAGVDSAPDITEWIRLEPGVTDILYRENGAGPETNIEVERRLRSRWT